MTITVTCNLCHASITSASVTEAMQWNDAHDDLCPGKPPTMTEREAYWAYRRGDITRAAWAAIMLAESAGREI